MSPSLELFLRTLDAAARGQPLGIEDTRKMAAGIGKAISGATLDESFDLASGWRGEIGGRLRDGVGELVGLTARQMHEKLKIYVATHYPADRDGGVRPTAEREVLFRLIAGHRGRAPSERAIQRLRAEREQAAIYPPAFGGIDPAPDCEPNSGR